MWSLGCVIAELFLGWPLYPGASEYDQVSCSSANSRKSYTFFKNNKSLIHFSEKCGFILAY